MAPLACSHLQSLLRSSPSLRSPKAPPSGGASPSSPMGSLTAPHLVILRHAKLPGAGVGGSFIWVRAEFAKAGFVLGLPEASTLSHANGGGLAGEADGGGICRTSFWQQRQVEQLLPAPSFYLRTPLPSSTPFSPAVKTCICTAACEVDQRTALAVNHPGWETSYKLYFRLVDNPEAGKAIAII